MLGAALRILRQPRYARLAALMLLVAVACVAAGTWQIVRFEQKVAANDALRTDADAPTAAVGRVLPLVGGAAVDADRVRLRRVTAAGRFDAAGQALVRGRSVGGSQGFVVLTPLRTRGAVLLVARGFVAADSSGNAPPVAPPPSGDVTVTGRVQTGDATPDSASDLPAGQLRSINPADQARRLRAPVYNGFVELLRGQPGTAGLTVLPPPDLSNPAGGALEPQHFAYIVQWYVFALLALAAPFAMARADRREATRDREIADQRPESGPEPQPAASTGGQPAVAAKLAERYGRASR